MPTLRIWGTRAEFVDQFDRAHQIGQFTNEAPQTLDFTIEYERTFSITSGATQKIYDTSTDISGFAFALVVVDSDGVEMQMTTAAGAGDQKFLETKLRKNWGFTLHTDYSRNGSSAVVDTFAGTADTIDEIWLKATGTGTCVAKILAGKA